MSQLLRSCSTPTPATRLVCRMRQPLGESSKRREWCMVWALPALWLCTFRKPTGSVRFIRWSSSIGLWLVFLCPKRGGLPLDIPKQVT